MPPPAVRSSTSAGTPGRRRARPLPAEPPPRGRRERRGSRRRPRPDTPRGPWRRARVAGDSSVAPRSRHRHPYATTEQAVSRQSAAAAVIGDQSEAAGISRDGEPTHPPCRTRVFVPPETPGIWPARPRARRSTFSRLPRPVRSAHQWPPIIHFLSPKTRRRRLNRTGRRAGASPPVRLQPSFSTADPLGEKHNRYVQERWRGRGPVRPGEIGARRSPGGARSDDVGRIEATSRSGRRRLFEPAQTRVARRHEPLHLHRRLAGGQRRGGRAMRACGQRRSRLAGQTRPAVRRRAFGVPVVGGAQPPRHRLSSGSAAQGRPANLAAGGGRERRREIDDAWVLVGRGHRLDVILERGRQRGRRGEARA